jgi:hypothetical protein
MIRAENNACPSKLSTSEIARIREIVGAFLSKHPDRYLSDAEVEREIRSRLHEKATPERVKQATDFAIENYHYEIRRYESEGGKRRGNPPMLVLGNPPMLVLGNPGISKEDANAIKGYVASTLGQSTSSMKADLASRLQGNVTKKQLRDFLKYAMQVRRNQEAHRAQMAREEGRETERLYEGPASTGPRRENLTPFALMVVGEKTGKVYAMDTSTGAVFTSKEDFKNLAMQFAGQVHAPEPLLVVKTAEPPYDPANLSPHQHISVKPRWAKKHAIYRVERQRNSSFREKENHELAQLLVDEIFRANVSDIYPDEEKGPAPIRFEIAQVLDGEKTIEEAQAEMPKYLAEAERHLLKPLKGCGDTEHLRPNNATRRLAILLAMNELKNYVAYHRSVGFKLNPSWHEGMKMPAPKRYTPKLPTDRPSTFDEAVSLGKKTGWVMVHGGDPDPRKMEALVKNLRDAKLSTDQGPDGSLWVYIGPESYFLGGPRKWKEDVNWAMKVLGLRPAFRDVNPVVDSRHERPKQTHPYFLEYKHTVPVLGSIGPGGKHSDIAVEVWSRSPKGKFSTQVVHGFQARVDDYPYPKSDWFHRDTNPPLGDLIPASAISAVTRALKKHGTGPALHKELVAILEPHRAELERKGVLVEYLAYAIEAAAGRSENPYEPPAEELDAPDPEFWTGFETKDDAEASELLDLFIQSSYTATKKGEAGNWIVWVYNHGLRSEKKRIESIAERKFEFRAKRLAERRAAESEEAGRMEEFRQQKNAEKVALILGNQPGGRKPGDLWTLVRTYGPGFEQSGSEEDWENWRLELEHDRSCLEEHGIEVAWTRNRTHGYFLWAWIGTESEILTQQDVQAAFDRRREAILASVRAYCRGNKIELGAVGYGPAPYIGGVSEKSREAQRLKETEGRQQNPAATARQENWEPRYWYDSWHDLVRRASRAIHDATYGPYNQTEETHPGMPKWSEKPTEHPTEWDKRAVRAIVDARNYLRAKSPERRHLGDTLHNIITYITRDLLMAKKRRVDPGSNVHFNNWARRTLKYAENYFTKSRPDPEFVGPIPSQHPWMAFEAAKTGRKRGLYSPLTGEIYRRTDWPSLLAFVYDTAEEAVKAYEADPEDVSSKLRDKLFPSYSYGKKQFVNTVEVPDEADRDAWLASVQAHTLQTKRSFDIALERKMDEIRAGDIVIGEGK